nr:VRR-NUC domain-containing protein [Chitinophaga parva]
MLKIIQSNKNGIPDLFAFRDGRTVWIEVKAPGKKADPLQELRMEELTAAGMEAYVVDSIDVLKYILDI